MSVVDSFAAWLVEFYNFRIVLQYADQLAVGLSNTLLAAGVSLVLSLLLGTLLAFARRSDHALLWRPADAYIQFIRATPLLVQIYLVYFGLPSLLPFTGRWPELWLGIMALTIHTTPYMAEIIRSGINAVPRGQIEGAMAVAMSPRQRMQYVILPQAFTNTLPAMLGQTAILIKDTSLLSAIAVFDLLNAGLLLNSERVRPKEGFLTVAAIYLAIYAVLVIVSRRIELRLGGAAWNRKPA